MRKIRFRLVLAVARVLGVPIKVRDIWFGGHYGVGG